MDGLSNLSIGRENREPKGIMKEQTIYIDELSGRRFDKQEDAIKSEKKNGGIKKMFSFWKYRPKTKGCDFENGGWCYQRSEGQYLMFMDTLIKAVNEYEPWIAKQYKEHGGLKREHMNGGYMIGRYLSDGGSELCDQLSVLSRICPKCFREWGQPYYAINCTHDVKPKDNIN
jgi:hypothetical protein